MIAVLIYHPSEGLILYDTGSCEDVITSWGTQWLECTPRKWDKEKNSLPAAIKATGNDIKDVKAVVVSHLHLDHAGGLEHFFGTDVEVWVHEDELKNAFWAAATRIDNVLYLEDYLHVSKLKWKTFRERSFDIWAGITLHKCEGHTEGSIIIELELEKEGTVIFTADLFHVKENYYEGRPQTGLMRDFNAWHRSRQFVMHLVKRKNARICFGHDMDVFNGFVKSPGYLE